MARRHMGNMKGERYLANTATKEIHDLYNEKSDCKIDKIISAEFDQPFTSLKTARKKGFKNGHSCVGILKGN